MIAFTAEEAGYYTFRVSFLKNGERETQNEQIHVIPEPAKKLVARLGQAVLPGQTISLRASIASEVDGTSLKWEYASGPKAINMTANTQGKRVIFFTAPQVEKDALMTFEVSAESEGVTLTDVVSVLVEAAPKIHEDAL